MAQTRTRDWRTAAASRQGRFARTGAQPQTGRRFSRSPQAGPRGQRQAVLVRRYARSYGRPSGGQSASRFARGRRRQPQPSGMQKVMQGVKGVLPGGSSGKRGGAGSIPVVGGLLSSLGGKKGGGARKPAMLGLLGAGAAGAAVVAKRRRGSGSGDTPTPPEHLREHAEGGPERVETPPGPRAGAPESPASQTPPPPPPAAGTPPSPPARERPPAGDEPV